MLVNVLWQQREATLREARVLLGLAKKAVDEGLYDRGMRFALQGLPPRGAVPITYPWSPDLERLLAGAAFASRQLSKFKVEGTAIDAIAMDAGARVAVASPDNVVRVFDFPTGREVAALVGHRAPIIQVNLSADGSRVMALAIDRKIRVWDVAHSEALSVIDLASRNVPDASWLDISLGAAALSPNGKRVLFTVEGQTILWDADNGSEVASMRTAGLPGVSPDSRRLLTQNENCHASNLSSANLESRRTNQNWIFRGQLVGPLAWDLGTGHELQYLAKEIYSSSLIAVAPDGERALIVDANDQLRIWDAFKGGEGLAIDVPAYELRECMFSYDGSRLGGILTSGQVAWWEAASGVRFSPSGQPPDARRVRFSADGTAIIAFFQDGRAVAWQTATGRRVAMLNAPVGRPSAFNRDGSLLVSISGGLRLGAEYPISYTEINGGRRPIVSTGEIALWDTGNRNRQLTGRPTADAGINSPGEDVERIVASSKNGYRILSRTSDGKTELLEAKSLKSIKTLHVADNSITNNRGPWGEFNTDGTRLVIWSSQGVSLIDASTGDILSKLEDSMGTSRITLSPNGKLVVTPASDGTARVWETESGHKVATLRGHSGAVTSATFSGDGSKLVTAAKDATARIWNTENWKEAVVLAGHNGEVLWAAISRDGTLAVTKSSDGTQYVWDARLGIVKTTLESSIKFLVASSRDDPTPQIPGVEFSPNLEFLVELNSGNFAELWRVSGSQSISVFSGTGDPIVTPEVGYATKTGTRGAQGRLESVRFGDSVSQLLMQWTDGSVDRIDIGWATRRASELRDRVCAEKLSGGAAEFATIELDEPYLKGLAERNPCLRSGPLSWLYWRHIGGEVWRSARALHRG
jgi:WD40 repeat protein